MSRALGIADAATLDVAVEACLEDLGLFTGVHVAFATLVDDRECVSDDWHWIQPGRVAEAPLIGSPLSATFGSATEFLRLGHTVAVDDLLGIELSPSEQALATANGLRAIVMSPVLIDGHLLGVVGLQMFDHPNQWPNFIHDQVETFAELIVRAVIRCRERGALAVANARARRIAECLPDGLLLCTLDGEIAWASPSFERMHGSPSSEIVGRHLEAVFHSDTRDLLRASVADLRRGGEATVTAQLQAAGSMWRWCDVALRCAHDRNAIVPDEIIVTVHDAHDQHEREAQLAERTRRDALTSLLNREAFDDELEALGAAKRDLVIAFCDVDDFKQVNDQLGHHHGDEILRLVAHALQTSIRSQDILARISGDEFAVALTDISSIDEVNTLGERLVEAVRDLNAGVSISVGVCGPRPGTDAQTIRQLADTAMYRAKRAGKDNWARVV